MTLGLSLDALYAEGVTAGSPGLRCGAKRGELPWVKVSEGPYPKGVIANSSALAITLSA